MSGASHQQLNEGVGVGLGLGGEVGSPLSVINTTSTNVDENVRFRGVASSLSSSSISAAKHGASGSLRGSSSGAEGQHRVGVGGVSALRRSSSRTVSEMFHHKVLFVFLLSYFDRLMKSIILQ